MHIHFILHESFEAPGAYLTWASARGHRISHTRVYQYEALPDRADFDMLIVMGGPQSPTEDRTAFPYYDPQAEIRLIRQAIAAEKFVVGVCLGAQLLGESYGAAFEHSPQQEIGNFPITLTPEGRQDPHLQAFADVETVGHWHGDMPGLTPQAEVLATSQGCPRQIVKYSPRHYGFQCHLEFSPAEIALLIEAEPNLAALSRQKPFVQNAEILSAFDYRAMNEKLFGFLDSLTHQ